MKKLTHIQFKNEYERRTGESFAYSPYGGVDLDETITQSYEDWVVEYEMLCSGLGCAEDE